MVLFLVWYGKVWFGLVWNNNHPKLLWKFHQNPTCFDWFREDLELVKIDKVWFGSVWYGLVWFETTSIKSYYESFIEIQLGFAFLKKIYSWFSLVRFGLVWYGLFSFETTSIKSYCENFIKIRLVLIDLEKIESCTTGSPCV